MISQLAIKNYALIEDIRVTLQPGLTIITGETGAGKSILLGALALLLGKRADLSSVKDNSKKCVIEAEFTLKGYGLEAVFDEYDLDYDLHTIIRREILPGGKSRAFVNDTPVNLSQLQSLAPYLVDIHSQNETLSLASEAYQLEVIDALAGNAELLQEYTSQLSLYRTVTETLEKLISEKETATKELDYHTFQHTELVEANLKGMDQQELEETFETLSNSEEIQEGIAQGLELLSEENVGTIETAKQVRATLSKLKNYASRYEDFWDRINSVIIELEDIFEALSEASDTVEADPSTLFELNAKLQTLYKLQQKHSVATVNELIEIQESLAEKIDTTLHLDSAIDAAKREKAHAEEIALQTASEIHKKRIAAIPELKKQLEAYLKELGLPNATFQFDLNASKTFRSAGTDTLELLFTANKGLAPAPLKKVASGGEMSRIMLAVKAVLAKYKKLPTIVFDEIDTGVSGEIANKMAKIMAEMSVSMQLISITHLPQIASKGAHHIKVYKEDVNERTVTGLKILTEEERIVEIAQMIGGKHVTDAALANAKELLN
ncbi:DNA repair protein RecN [Cochleicola gelatinilyticus]|uniref:DNA repair protein RecN n=1 Tax=Cochleicola gelatinilyticus TaxID=1763537 RepID=A0A167HEN4_9FLAO|nr:DNA repair protein RecN [Cochleicola gelatinilyticus]OAB78527.1 DNA repair protein RecN [Cochleicola gelatinilyticus]